MGDIITRVVFANKLKHILKSFETIELNVSTFKIFMNASVLKYSNIKW